MVTVRKEHEEFINLDSKISMVVQKSINVKKFKAETFICVSTTVWVEKSLLLKEKPTFKHLNLLEEIKGGRLGVFLF